MIVKTHTNNGQMILAICDSNLVGNVFEEDNKILDLRSEFYKGKQIEEKELKFLCKKSYIINGVGDKTISFLMDEKLITDKDILTIKDTKYVVVVVEI